MVVRKTLTALGLSVALAVVPTLASAQSQAGKTGTGSQTGVTAGQDDNGYAGLTATQVALAAALGIGIIAVTVAVTGDDDDDDVTAPGTGTATQTQQ
jgi:hypothetical protein